MHDSRPLVGFFLFRSPEYSMPGIHGTSLLSLNGVQGKYVSCEHMPFTLLDAYSMNVGSHSSANQEECHAEMEMNIRAGI